jgi:hypothetical protein
MVAMSPDPTHGLVERAHHAPAIAGVVHGLVFVTPVWALLASVVVVFVAR